MTEKHSDRSNGGTFFSESMIHTTLACIKARQLEVSRFALTPQSRDVMQEELDRLERAINNEWNYIVATRQG